MPGLRSMSSKRFRERIASIGDRKPLPPYPVASGEPSKAITTRPSSPGRLTLRDGKVVKE